MNRLTLLIVICFFCVIMPSFAQSSAHGQLYIQHESKLWLEGTSTLHDYSSKATKIVGTIEMDSLSAEMKFKNMESVLSKAEIIIPIKSMHSESEKMDNNMYEALKADDHPEILYKFMQDSIISDSNKDSLILKAIGKLTVAGKENTTEMKVTLTKNNDGSIRVTGAKELFMTDFGVDPPSFMLGVLKTNNRVIVKFDLLLRSQNNNQQ